MQVLSKAALAQWQVQYGSAADLNDADSLSGGEDGDGAGSLGDSSSNNTTPIEAVTESSKKRQLPLWQWLLPLLLVLLLIEAITANRVLQRFRASV